MSRQASVVCKACTLYLACYGVPVGIASISPKNHITCKVGLGICRPLQCHRSRRSLGCKSLGYGRGDNLACSALRQELPQTQITLGHGRVIKQPLHDIRAVGLLRRSRHEA